MDGGQAALGTLKVGRLTRRAQFVSVAGSGRRAATPGLVLQARRHDSRQHPADGEGDVRVGFTASRKVGKAVVRNRARRRLRAVAAAVLPQHALPGHDFVLIARAGGTNARPFAELKADLVRALRRVGAYRGQAAAAPGTGAERAR
jgi:ribonuclease P protein component